MKIKKIYKGVIITLSVLIPLVVTALFFIKIPGRYDVSFLPRIYACINGVTAVLLIVAIWAIKNKKRRLHELLIKVCIVLSIFFLVMYLVYHIFSNTTHFGGEGFIKYLYFIFLITHILLSVVIIPYILFTFSYATIGNFEKHKKIARITFPLWLYVAVTGVIIYIMISPYYSS